MSGNVVGSLQQQPLRCSVLLYLAVRGETTRSALAQLFWPDSGRARALLSQTLYELKRTLGEGWLDADGERIRVKGGGVDVRLFEEAVQRKDYVSAVTLYGGRFLADFDGVDTVEFRAWADQTSAHLERLHRRARRELIEEATRRENPKAALVAAQDWARLDPLEDEAQHRTIELLAGLGRRSEALQVYEAYRRTLKTELDLEPLDDTRRLAETLSGSGSAGFAPLSLPQPSPEPIEPSTAVLPVRRSRWSAPLSVLGLVALMIVLGIAYVLVIPRSSVIPTDEQGLSLSRIAVLYFDDDSPNENLGYISKGLTEALIQEFSGVPALSVVSRNGVKPYYNSAIPLDSIARTLKVGTIVEGSVQLSGDVLRVRVHLVDAASGSRIESQTIDRPLTNLFELQDAVAAEIARFLRHRLGREIVLRTERALARNAEAWRLYQLADEAREQLIVSNPLLQPGRPQNWDWVIRTADSLATEAQRRDTRWIDPLLLRGWLAHDAALLSRSPHDTLFELHIRQGLAIADKAIRKSPKNPRAAELRGTLLWRLARDGTATANRDSLFHLAEADLRAAVGTDPKLAQAWHTLGRIRLYAGGQEEAAMHLTRAYEEDSFLRETPEILNLLYRAEMDRRRFVDAEKWCLKGFKEFPTNYLFLECQLLIPSLEPKSISMDSALRIMAALERLDPEEPDAPKEYKHVFRKLLMATFWARNDEQDSAYAILARARKEAASNPAIAKPFGSDAARLLLVLVDTPAAVAELKNYLKLNPQYESFILRHYAFRAVADKVRARD